MESNNKPPQNLLFTQARNCLEYRLVNQEIDIEEYEILINFLNLLQTLDGKYELGDGIVVLLSDLKEQI